MSKTRAAFHLLVCIGVCFLAGIVGGLGMSGQLDDWYRTLERPVGSPPNWVFGPVWSTLYALMGVALWQVLNLRRERGGANGALGLFATQLVLNAIWPFIFFRYQLLGLGFIEIVALWMAILATFIAFLRVKRSAGWLLLPYLAWVSYAMYLNLGFWMLNR